jgi:hypothetical protein
MKIDGISMILENQKPSSGGLIICLISFVLGLDSDRFWFWILDGLTFGYWTVKIVVAFFLSSSMMIYKYPNQTVKDILIFKSAKDFSKDFEGTPISINY